MALYVSKLYHYLACFFSCLNPIHYGPPPCISQPLAPTLLVCGNDFPNVLRDTLISNIERTLHRSFLKFSSRVKGRSSSPLLILCSLRPTWIGFPVECGKAHLRHLYSKEAQLHVHRHIAPVCTAKKREAHFPQGTLQQFVQQRTKTTKNCLAHCIILQSKA